MHESMHKSMHRACTPNLLLLSPIFPRGRFSDRGLTSGAPQFAAQPCELRRYAGAIPTDLAGTAQDAGGNAQASMWQSGCLQYSRQMSTPATSWIPQSPPPPPSLKVHESSRQSYALDTCWHNAFNMPGAI
jgi:hypothetical protein